MMSEREEKLKGLSSQFTVKDAFCLLSFVSFVEHENNGRSGIERVIDKVTGYLGATPEVGVDYVQGFYEGKAPKYLIEFITLLLTPVKK